MGRATTAMASGAVGAAGRRRQPQSRWRQVLAPMLLGLLLCAALAGCAVRLVPAYDPALVAALDDLNVRTLVLFGELEHGAPASSYAAHEDDYAGLVGGFEALVLRAEARPVPLLAGRLAALDAVAALCGGVDAQACVNSSPASMTEIVTTLRAMRDGHRSRGLPADLVALHKSAYRISMHQAMTVETALSR